MKNIYIEGNNLYLQKTFKGELREIEIQDSIFWKEGKIKIREGIKRKWFIIEGSEVTFWDEKGNVLGFYYEDEGYRIWATSFKISEIDTLMRDSILLYGVEKILKEEKEEETKEVEITQTNIQELTVSPNPLSTETEITFVLKNGGIIELEIYDVTGKRIKKLKEGIVSRGIHRMKWDGKDEVGNEVRNGVYFLKVVANKKEKRFVKIIIFK
jgi:hypothetical protein